MLLHALMRRRDTGDHAFVNISTARGCRYEGPQVVFDDTCLVTQFWPTSNDVVHHVKGLRFSDDFRRMNHPVFQTLILVPCTLHDNIVYAFWCDRGRCSFAELCTEFERYWTRVVRTLRVSMPSRHFDMLFTCEARCDDTCDVVYVVGRSRWMFAPRVVHYMARRRDGRVVYGRLWPRGEPVFEEGGSAVTFESFSDEQGVRHEPLAVVRISDDAYTVRHTTFDDFVAVEFSSAPFDETVDWDASVRRNAEAVRDLRKAAVREHFKQLNARTLELNARHGAFADVLRYYGARA